MGGLGGSWRDLEGSWGYLGGLWRNVRKIFREGGQPRGEIKLMTVDTAYPSKNSGVSDVFA